MCQSLRLWIAFKFVSLYRMTQQILDAHSSHFCCELLSNLYLCIGWHSPWAFPGHALWVVNCFQICIFVSDDTARHTHNLCLAELWIAFKFVSLYRMTQLLGLRAFKFLGCELLSNLYLCIGWHSMRSFSKLAMAVVNCFQICIFVSDDTAHHELQPRRDLLWIAFKFVSLYRMTQPNPALHTPKDRLWIAFKFVSLYRMTQPRWSQIITNQSDTKISH